MPSFPPSWPPRLGTGGWPRGWLPEVTWAPAASRGVARWIAIFYSLVVEFQPIWKIWSSNWKSSPNRGEHKKNWNRRLSLDLLTRSEPPKIQLYKWSYVINHPPYKSWVNFFTTLEVWWTFSPTNHQKPRILFRPLLIGVIHKCISNKTYTLKVNHP